MKTKHLRIPLKPIFILKSPTFAEHLPMPHQESFGIIEGCGTRQVSHKATYGQRPYLWPKSQGMKNRLKKIILISIPIVLLILAAPYIFLFGTMSGITVKERLDRRAFDSQTWKQGNQSEVRVRRMDSLLPQHNLIEKSRGEVVALIGEPDNTSYFREYDMVNPLGMERVTEFRIVPDRKRLADERNRLTIIGGQGPYGGV
jgi:hypothetical protein